MSEKGPDAFRTIGEVAEELDLPQHVLRFWETKFSQIRPTKRSSGRRFYRPEDVILVRTIRDLLYRDGYTIRGVQQLLRERGIRGASQVPAAGEAPSPAQSRDASSEEDRAHAIMGSTDSMSGAGSPAGNATAAYILEELRECVGILRVARRAA